MAFSANITESRIFWGATLKKDYLKEDKWEGQKKNGRQSDKKVDKPK